MTKIAPVPWTCPTCADTRTTPFCATCGEEPLKPRDLTLHGLTLLICNAFSPVDGKLLRSLRSVVMRPGALTDAFQTGLRKPFVGPFQLFLITNVLFFAVQSFSSFRIFTGTLDHRLHGQVDSEFGQALVDARLAATGKTLAQYAPVFDQAVATNAKSLIGLMVPLLAVLLPLVFWRRHRPLAVHFVFSLHFYSFLLVIMCIPLAMITLNMALSGARDVLLWIDNGSGALVLLARAVYLYIAVQQVYDTRGFGRIVQTLVLTMAVFAIFMIYRFLLLPITLYTT